MPIKEPLTFINRRQEIAQFSELLARKEQGRILFISGRGGMGKTSLLNLYREICVKAEVANATFAFRAATSHPIEVIWALSEELHLLGHAKLRKTLDQIEPDLPKDLDQDAFDSTELQFALSGFDKNLQETQLRSITESFFDGVKTILAHTESVVCFLDDIELAGPMTRDWLSYQFLESVHNTPGTMCVAAGRQSIDPESSWSAAYTHLNLDPIYALKDWLEYAQRLRLDLSPETINSLAGLFQGRPLEMAMAMSTMADRE